MQEKDKESGTKINIQFCVFCFGAGGGVGLSCNYIKATDEHTKMTMYCAQLDNMQNYTSGTE